MRRQRTRVRLALLTTGLLAALSLPLTAPASAAPSRYEAESATIAQGVVESNHAGFSGTGFVNYDNMVGSSVEFTVNAPTAGPATLTFRFANATAVDRALDISVNGTLAADELAFTGTGAWTTWATKSITVNLHAGANAVRATATTATGGPNLDYIDVDAAAAPAADYQAENATIAQGVVESNHTGYTGTGFVNYNNVAGSYVEFTSNAPTAGLAKLVFRYANGTAANRPMDISVNGSVVSAGVAFVGTGAWTSWQEVTVNTSVPAGAVKVRATATSATGGPNLDRLTADVAIGEPGPPTPPGNLRSTAVTSTSISLAWQASTDDVGVAGYELNRGGTRIQIDDGNATSYTDTGLSANTEYTYSVRAFDAAGNYSPPSNQIMIRTSGGGGGGTPAAINGQLRVCGLKLCNQYGKPIQLRGMSTHGLQWYPQCVNNASLDALAKDWKADVIRLSMYIQEGGYETNPRRFTDLMHSLIEQATARGMYAIVDWHQLSPGDPNYNLARAKTFFTEIAQRHKDKTNILYDVANEPNGVSWARVREYHEQIIPVIRAQDPDSVILLGTHAWGSLGVSDGRSETDVINNPVRATNVLYTFHFYAASHGTEYLNTLSRAADRIPVFVTEFGTQTASGDGGNNFGRSQQYIDLMASKKISWVNWNYSDDSRSGAVFTGGTCPGGPFAGTSRLKPAGVWVRDRIRTPDDFPTG